MLDEFAGHQFVLLEPPPEEVHDLFRPMHCMTRADALHCKANRHGPIGQGRVRFVRFIHNQEAASVDYVDIANIMNYGHWSLARPLAFQEIADGGAFYTFPRFPGGTLVDLYQTYDAKFLPEALLAHIFACLMRALQFVHSGFKTNHASRRSAVGAILLDRVRVRLSQHNPQNGYPDIYLSDFSQLQSEATFTPRVEKNLLTPQIDNLDAAMKCDVMRVAECIHFMAHQDQYPKKSTDCACPAEAKYSDAFEDVLNKAVKGMQSSSQLIKPLEALAERLRVQDLDATLPDAFIQACEENSISDGQVLEYIDASPLCES